MSIITPKVEIDFTDELLTPKGGLTFLARFAASHRLPQILTEKIKLKVRNRGPSDVHYLLSLIYSIALGEGNLCDVDLLKEDLAPKGLWRGLRKSLTVEGSRNISAVLMKKHLPSFSR
ncbi:hypothetical protein TH606_03035 [Thermodesulfatator autotrophicus]|uniref:Uncharacterized protein n=1 Tax=Thermodesulfatator autotrophicus TaxID=1795632 RepID=A0A177E9P1_9BACT|nr:hypothetical protein TH606_03035 [Thermodesulfatator autotrophicus]